MATKVRIINETLIKYHPSNWSLCFQWCEYIYDDDEPEFGFRFIRRRPNGYLQPASGQVRIPSLTDMQMLIEQARAEGWLVDK